MFKAIAVLLLFSSCTMAGFFQSAQLSRRKKLLMEYRDFLQRLETEMGYFKEPLPRLFQKIHQNTNNPLDILLRQCLINMEITDLSIDKIWETAIYTAYAGEPLKSSDFTTLSKCGTFIGQSSFQGQQSHFDLLLQELSVQIRNAEELCKTKGALYSKAGLSVGAVLAIALL